ncbi:MAG: TonB-dependent receptor plug domain-containing protein, partial [Gemmatimonadaceae bacterium]|nr:TonB-dependent receptor plug domain-containing protein [Gemmatimonadaceae bacterium]
MLMRHLLRRGLLTPLVLCAMLTPSVAMAQELAARVSGVVREQGGHPLPGARVTFVPGGAATITDSGGRFTLSIPPRESGTLTVQRLGFEAAAMAVPSMPDGTRRDIAITLTGLARLDVVSVIASRARPLLDTRNATTGGAIEREELEHLPTDARDPIALGYNIPGVAQATGFFGDAPRLTVNGANSLYTQYTLDGLDNNEGFLGGPRVEVPLSALARFAVQANTYGAELGRSSNGVVTMESRAGEDRWTGEAFAYDRPGIPVDAKAAVVPNGENA